jgi:hypothetical protein
LAILVALKLILAVLAKLVSTHPFELPAGLLVAFLISNTPAAMKI